ncbi:MAG: hypothetical protein ACJAVK_000005 [Akkermansiaceae bacterium]|jgi:hypothetical protein
MLDDFKGKFMLPSLDFHEGGVEEVMLIGALVVFWVLGSGLALLVWQGVWVSKGRKGESPSDRGGVLAVLAPLIVFSILIFLGWLVSPLKPSRGGIIGKYEIDPGFHPGAQADWQHDTYTMEITRDEVVLRDARATKEWRHAIEWFDGVAYRWRFNSLEEKHHMVRGGPGIIREAFGYYYVFESPLYGEVVFRKKAGFPWWVVWVLAGVGVGLFWWRKAERGTPERAIP